MKRIILIICVFAFFNACNDDEKAALDLSVTPSIIEFENVESTKKVYVASNDFWSASSNEEWCIAMVVQASKNDSVGIKVVENTSYYERIAYVSFENKDKTIIKTVKVIQKSIGRQLTRQADSLLLVSLYDTLGGDDWTDNTGWKNSNLENWIGVRIENDRVTGLKIANNNLSGELIPELSQLAMLDTLSIVAEPGLTGIIPIELANLSNLRYLNISETSIEGNIPPELGNMTALEELILSENLNFTGTIPKELGNLSNLKLLNINNLPLGGGIPAELGNLSNLKYLALDSCKFISIPAEIFGLTNLEYLSLNNNRLSGSIPAGITALTNLKHLILSNNLFGGTVSTELAALTNLKHLSLSNNFFGGSIPPELATLTNLKHLILSNNFFVGSIPSELDNLELETLRLEYNYLEGDIPNGILGKIDGESFCVCPQIGNTFDNYNCN
ncbi:MAG: leucine-rich repeat domain-containing protein [Prevotellaceae bacterium]|jgi:Leucine-rich repeat (LRR) protein|nr:leucine-rich repeat domain-containing protein [Prevotellaceae bacterium]